MTGPSASAPDYKTCPAQAFYAEFGVCRGEAISRLEDLNLGDIYLVKPDTVWLPVTEQDPDAASFSLDLAANLPTAELTTLAHLVFMTTTGRRADVFAAVSMGQMYIVTQTPLKRGPEYVLIHIETREVDFAPQVIPAPMLALGTGKQPMADVIPLQQRA